ncbi:MAG: hypothetical protein ABJC62_05385 [Frankiaceae bacterium]
MTAHAVGVLDTNVVVLLRAFDALIAATAIASELPVYTCNAQDFSGIDELTVVAVPHPHAG